MKRIFITGASAGIGRATALAFARLGSELILVARRMDRLETVKEECEKAGSPKTWIFPLDVQDAEATFRLFAEQTALIEGVDVLVNNAGLALGLAPFQETEFSAIRTMLRTNVEGAFAIAHAIVPFFLKRGGGHLVQLGSVAGRWTYPKGHAYAASKAALRSFNESLRLDLVGKNIRVTEIAPGMVETEFSRVRFAGDEAKAASVYAGMNALTPDDIADAITWVCQKPKHVNVQELVIYPTDQASPTVVHRK